MRRLHRFNRWGIWVEVGCFVLTLPFVLALPVQDMPEPWSTLAVLLDVFFVVWAYRTVRRLEPYLVSEDD